MNEQLQNDLIHLESLLEVQHKKSIYDTYILQWEKGIRASFVNWRTTKQDIEIVIREMTKLTTTK